MATSNHKLFYEIIELTENLTIQIIDFKIFQKDYSSINVTFVQIKLC